MTMIAAEDRSSEVTLRPGWRGSEGFSRLRMPAEGDLPDDLRALLADSGETMAVRAGGLDPAGLSRFFAYLGPLLDPERPGLSHAERCLIAVVVSGWNRCVTCVITNERLLAEAIVDPLRARRLAVNYAHAVLSLRERALGDFAVKLTREPHSVFGADIDRLRAVGLGDEEIYDAVQVTAVINCTNRLHSALGTRPDDDFVLAGGHPVNPDPRTTVR